MKYFKWVAIALIVFATFWGLNYLQSAATFVTSFIRIASVYVFAVELLVIGAVCGVLYMEWR